MAQDIVGSRMQDFPAIQPANKDNTQTGYGENGYEGASSDTDLANPTRSRLAVNLVPDPKAVLVNSQTRDVGVSNVKPAFGMTGPKPSAKI